jgi:hypothetical protein
MALLDEELVEQWLNQKKFFTMRGIKCGVDEIDLLAINYADGAMTCWHVEVQVSFRPVGYVGGDTSARKRTDAELKVGVAQWVQKKFTSDKKKLKRDSILPNANWQFVLVCAELKDEAEIPLMEELGVQVIRYRDVLNEVIAKKEHQTSSIANNIIEILQYSMK